jgi:CspA family cold shock protein
MPTGTVKFFNFPKGFGFLVPDDGSADVFVHIKDVQKSGVHEILEGQRYSFDVVEGRAGKPNAANLRLLP